MTKLTIDKSGNVIFETSGLGGDYSCVVPAVFFKNTSIKNINPTEPIEVVLNVTVDEIDVKAVMNSSRFS